MFWIYLEEVVVFGLMVGVVVFREVLVIVCVMDVILLGLELGFEVLLVCFCCSVRIFGGGGKSEGFFFVLFFFRDEKYV